MRHTACRHPDTSGPSARSALRAVCVVLALLLAVSAASAEKALIVLSSDSGAYKSAASACERTLRAGGWTSTTVMLDRTDPASVRSRGYDAVITLGASASAAMAGKTATPLVYGLTPDPASLGLTTLDGVSGIGSEPDAAQRFKLVRSILPRARSAGVLIRGSSKRSETLLGHLREDAPPGWKIEAIDLDEFGSVSEGIRALLARGVDVAWMIPDPAVYNSSVVKALLLDAIRAETPVVGFSTKLARSGAIIGIGIDPARVGERAAELVLNRSHDRHERPSAVFALNAIVARRLGIELPSALEQRAADVYTD